MATWPHFPHHWKFVRGNPPITGGFPSQRVNDVVVVVNLKKNPAEHLCFVNVVPKIWTLSGFLQHNLHIKQQDLPELKFCMWIKMFQHMTPFPSHFLCTNPTTVLRLKSPWKHMLGTPLSIYFRNLWTKNENMEPHSRPKDTLSGITISKQCIKPVPWNRYEDSFSISRTYMSWFLKDPRL